MDFYGKYKSPLGYYNNANQIDSYGVNHSGFTTRDELEYQFARQQRENELMNQCKAQGVMENFPQYGANFWGNSANNYGFGLFDITSNIGNMNKAAALMSLKQTQPKTWETALDGKEIYDDIIRKERNFSSQEQNKIDYGISAVKGGYSLLKNYFRLKNLKMTDKYKHAFMNCNASQYGQGGANIAEFASNIRETYDRMQRKNSLDSSVGDQYANQIGRFLGSKYPKGDCDEIVQRYIRKNL